MNRYCLALDLKNNFELIEEYKVHHQKVWPEIKKSISEAGIAKMDIYLTGNRLFMIIEVDASFSFAAKVKSDLNNAFVQEWEALMWKYQEALPFAEPGEKWILMDHIFSLKA